MGRPWGIFLVSAKLDTFLLSDSADFTVVRAVVLTQYRRVTDGRAHRRTDGQTDGIAVASTALAMRALRRAVKTLSGKVLAQSIAFRAVSVYWQGVAPLP